MDVGDQESVDDARASLTCAATAFEGALAPTKAQREVLMGKVMLRARFLIIACELGSIERPEHAL